METAQVLKLAPPQSKAPPTPHKKAPAVGEPSGEQAEPRSSAEKHEGAPDRGEALIGERYRPPRREARQEEKGLSPRKLRLETY